MSITVFIALCMLYSTLPGVQSITAKDYDDGNYGDIPLEHAQMGCTRWSQGSTAKKETKNLRMRLDDENSDLRLFERLIAVCVLDEKITFCISGHWDHQKKFYLWKYYVPPPSDNADDAPRCIDPLERTYLECQRKASTSGST